MIDSIFNSAWFQEFFTLPQMIGILGYLVGVSAFLQRSDRAFRIQLTLVNIILACHFYLLGPDSYTAALLNIVNIFRNLASMRTRHFLVMLFFIAVMWLISLPTIHEPIQYLSVIGTSIVTYSMFRLQNQAMRYGILLSGVLWIIYSLWIESIGGLAIEITFAVINIITIIKLNKSDRKTPSITEL